MKVAVAFKKILAPYRLKVLRRIVGSNRVTLLDVGCGNESCQLTRHWLNVGTYHGIDKEFWHDKKEDYDRMDNLYLVDLEEGRFGDVPDGTFDVIIMSHVIEHLKNGYEVIGRLIPKLAKGGVIYIETPSYRTINYPSAEGLLNFYDDPTHKRIYSPFAIADLFMAQGLKVLKCGYRRDWVRLFLLSPVAIVLNFFYYLPFRRRFLGSGLWDLLGVATVVVARNSAPERTGE